MEISIKSYYNALMQKGKLKYLHIVCLTQPHFADMHYIPSS